MIGRTHPGQQSGSQDYSERWVGQILGVQSKREAGQVGCKYSPDIAVGSSDHPGLADERATTEVEAIAVLESGVRVGGELKLYVGMKHPGPYPTLTQGVYTCRETCQGQEPGTAFSPLTIL